MKVRLLDSEARATELAAEVKAQRLLVNQLKAKLESVSSATTDRIGHKDPATQIQPPRGRAHYSATEENDEDFDFIASLCEPNPAVPGVEL